ncbi:hypothetical protein [Kitasatospora cheerisanensis]|uniref:Uncharacterized protein n=1 Tax=Kitasatospora cheerisanensis KCTC 2395 TaxID=1348663 RepID=A0A066YVE4_9ACTN|nr:hypothetical protein [Kitasatospora cheerisanensis]KDN81905.1 hypothetical protein KCH_63440 [Kitasatospora cheerisanensis KCTC 2395]
MGERNDHPQGPDAAEDSGAQEIEATVVLGIRITDWPALRAAARAAVEDLDFAGIDPEGQRGQLLREVSEDPNAALGALLHPDRLVAAIPGIEALGGTLEISVTDDFAPDFAALFPLDDDSDTGDWTLTPRTACLLHTQLISLSDAAYEDLDEHGDDPVTVADEGDWSVFGRLQQRTWNLHRGWRRAFARAFDDLADDLALGEWPLPRSLAEDVALRLALADARALLGSQPESVADMMGDLPADLYDYDWDGCADELFGVYGPEETEDDLDAGRRIDRLLAATHPEGWFLGYEDAEERDPERGYRR